MTPSQYDPRYQDLLPQDPKFKMCKFKSDKVMCFAAGECVNYNLFRAGNKLHGTISTDVLTAVEDLQSARHNI